jgi:hypothetical protein
LDIQVMKQRELILCLCVCLFCRGAAAEEVKFVMSPPISPPGGNFSIVGGEPAEPLDWPATFILNPPGCTSTGIGERVILTAAHCVDDRARGKIALLSGTRIGIVCDRHPYFREGRQPPQKLNRTKDFALCLADTPLMGFPFERVGAPPSGVTRRGSIVLLGYGCTQAGGFDPDFGVLFTGPTMVDRLPASADDVEYVTKSQIAGCGGDSGGGAYSSGDERRWLMAVVSRGNKRTTTWLPSTSVVAFVDWARSWSETNKVRICGLHGDAAGCR